MNKLLELFYKLMYRKHVIKRKCSSGRTYVVEYHRSPFWTYEERTLKRFFKEKVGTWHGQVWEVFENGGRCGFGTICLVGTLFPYFAMKKFLIAETNYLEKILNKEKQENDG
jgi:hypothetical protein